MIKLFCVTYAGGTSKFFQGLSNELSGHIECIGIEYAGHGTRRAESLYTSFGEMVQDVAEQINEKLSMEDQFSLFGYSMGSLVAYDVLAKDLLKTKASKLFVAAHNAPSISSIKKTYSTMPDEEFLKCMLEFGGIDKVFIQNKRFWPIYLPIIRNDYRLLEQYDFEKTKKQLSIGGGVFYSETDTPYRDIEPWKNVFSKDLQIYKFEGSHFFMRNNEKVIAKIIMEALM